MIKTLIDSGVIIALFDKSDTFHQKSVEFLRTFKGELITSWAVMTEVSHMLDFNQQVQIDFLKWAELGGLKVHNITQDEIVSIRLKMEKYLDIPMNLGNATLMHIANKEKIGTIVSIDSDSDIYRTLKKQNLINLLR